MMGAVTRYGNSPVHYMREQQQAAEMASGDASGSPKRGESRNSEKQSSIVSFTTLLEWKKVTKTYDCERNVNINILGSLTYKKRHNFIPHGVHLLQITVKWKTLVLQFGRQQLFTIIRLSKWNGLTQSANLIINGKYYRLFPIDMD